MIKRWLTARELMKRWHIGSDDLADMILHRELIAYESSTHRPLNLEVEIISICNPFPALTKNAPTLIQRVHELIFKLSDVEEMEKLQNFIPHKSEEEKKELRPKSPNTVEEFINDQKQQGIPDEIIAVYLFDPEGRFNLTDLKIARALDLGDGLNEDQVSALKQRGRRLRIEGQNILQRYRK
jgi:hypothetical protein